VISHADSETGGDPIYENRGREITPAEQKQRRDGTDVKKAERNRRRPVQAIARGEAEVIFARLGNCFDHAIAGYQGSQL
jgi:hypothetical protein